MRGLCPPGAAPGSHSLSRIRTTDAPWPAHLSLVRRDQEQGRRATAHTFSDLSPWISRSIPTYSADGMRIPVLRVSIRTVFAKRYSEEDAICSQQTRTTEVLPGPADVFDTGGVANAEHDPRLHIIHTQTRLQSPSHVFPPSVAATRKSNHLDSAHRRP